MEIKRVDDRQIAEHELVTITVMNHLVEVQHMEKRNSECHIKKLDANTYVDKRTGEIKEFERIQNRSQSANSLRQTFKKLRYLINNNFVGNPNELFVTLTYARQTSCHLEVGKDYDNFLKRLKRRLKAEYGTIDAIRVLEPHASGCWHLHVLLRFNDVSSVYIPNGTLSEIWGRGFVTIKSLQNVDNIGAYLSAYLADIDVPDDYNNADVVIKEINGEQKKFIKGARLAFYPAGVNIFTKTKGITYPAREEVLYEDIKKVVRTTNPHYKKTIAISDEQNNYSNKITYEQYNLKRI